MRRSRRPSISCTRLAREHGLKFRMAVINAEIDKNGSQAALAKAPFESIGPAGTLTPEMIDRCGPDRRTDGHRALHQRARCRRRCHHRRPRVRRRDFRGAADSQGLRQGLVAALRENSRMRGAVGDPVRSRRAAARPRAARSFRSRALSSRASLHDGVGCRPLLYERGDPCLQPGSGRHERSD